MNSLLLPFATAFDPPQQAEGSLDPLGLYSIADALGVRLAPGVRERQSTPRYLTLAMAGYSICQGDLRNLVTEKSPPAWLVFEWLVVIALVAKLRGSPDFHDIPGRDKVGDCLTRKEAVCASNYLKTPAVFGFHGIYRVFGVKAGMFDGQGNLFEPGRRVLNSWQQDQNLSGFTDGTGPGASLRSRIERTIRRGLESGFLEPTDSSLYAEIAEHFNPHKPGPKERESLWSTVVDSDPLRGEFAAWLISDEGQKQWVIAEKDEAVLQRAFLDHASPQMRQLLLAIQSYERLARLLTDAFDEARWISAQEKTMDAAELARNGKCLRLASEKVPNAFREMLAQVGEVDITARMRAEKALSTVAEPGNPTQFTQNLLAHHARIQRAKPPNGKRSWFDMFDNGRIAVRPTYALEEFEERSGQYVHAYRTRPIWSFARNLGRVLLPVEQL